MGVHTQKIAKSRKEYRSESSRDVTQKFEIF